MSAGAPGAIERHIDFLAHLHIVWAAFNGIIVAGLAFFGAAAVVLAHAMRATEPGAEIAAVVTAAGFFVLAALSVVWALVHRWCGRALLRRERGGRLFALVLAIGDAFLFPLGTLLAGYTLWVLLPEAARQRFEAPETYRRSQRG